MATDSDLEIEENIKKWSSLVRQINSNLRIEIFMTKTDLIKYIYADPEGSQLLKELSIEGGIFNISAKENKD